MNTEKLQSAASRRVSYFKFYKILHNPEVQRFSEGLSFVLIRHIYMTL